MDSVTLLAEARAAGLTVTAEGDRLIVRGPRAAEVTARALLARKADVLAALAPPPDFPRSRVPAFPRCDDPAIAWRVEAMRAGLPVAGPLPFLVARETPRAAGGCLRCGEPLRPRTEGLGVCCAPCVHAAQLVTAEYMNGGQPA